MICYQRWLAYLGTAPLPTSLLPCSQPRCLLACSLAHDRYDLALNTSMEHQGMLLAVENGLMFGNYFWSLVENTNGDGDQV